MGGIVLKPAIPILFVRDVPASAAFFRDKLGFGIDFLHGDPPFYGAVSRGAACLHLRCVRAPNFAALAAPAAPPAMSPPTSPARPSARCWRSPRAT